MRENLKPNPKPCNQDGINLMQQYRLTVNRIQHSFAEKDLEVLVDQAWNTSQYCTHTEIIWSLQASTQPAGPHLEFHVQL